MLLDPRFKDKFFCGIVERAHAKTLLETKLSETRTTTTSLSTDPPEKHARKDVMKVFDEIINEASADVSVVSGNALVDTYLAEPFTSYQSGNAYAWWKENRSRFKPLSCLASKYLSAPPTSVPSERLFSIAGHIYDEKHNRLSPERAETLMFIKNTFICYNHKHFFLFFVFFFEFLTLSFSMI